MGRFVGWIGPFAYVLALVVAAVAGATQLAWPSCPATDSLDNLFNTLVPWIVGVLWIAAMLWFVSKAVIIAKDETEDEGWTSHMLCVGFVCRLILAPLCVTATLAALYCTWWAFAGHGGGRLDALGVALVIWAAAALLVLPVSLHQVCAATRLATRGLLSATSLAWHVVLAFMPTLGFVAACGLYANGRDAVQDAHDKRVGQLAVAEAQAANAEQPAANGD